MEALKILITGIGGMAGRHVAIAAAEAGYMVSGTIHTQELPELVALRKRHKVDIYPYDLMSPAKFLLDICRPDVIIHLAGYGIDNPSIGFGVYSQNVVMLHSIAQAALDQEKKPRLIVASSTTVYGRQDSANPVFEQNWRYLADIDAIRSPYRSSKLSQERYLDEMVSPRDPYFEYVVARPGQHMGPGRKPGVVEYDVAREIKRILSGGEPIIHVRNKLAEVDILDTRDVALAYLLLALRGQPGEQYNVVSSVPTTVEKLCRVMLGVAGVTRKDIQIQSSETEITTFARFSNARLRGLGWEPKHTTRDAVKSFWDWFIKR